MAFGTDVLILNSKAHLSTAWDPDPKPYVEAMVHAGPLQADMWLVSLEYRGADGQNHKAAMFCYQIAETLSLAPNQAVDRWVICKFSGVEADPLVPITAVAIPINFNEVIQQ